MTYDPEKVIRIATKLKAAREQVAALETQLRLVVLEQGENGASAPRRRRQAGLSEVATKVVKLFEENPQKDFSAEHVWNALGMEETYARPLLSRLAKGGSIEKRGRGLYGAVRQPVLTQ